MQIEKSLVTEVRLWAGVPNEQDLRHRVEVEEKVVSLLIALFEAFQQIYLEFNVI